MSDYETLYEGGRCEDGGGRMYVRLYPGSQFARDDLRRGEQAPVDLRNTCETLLAADAIACYRIEAFEPPMGAYPDLGDGSNIGRRFEDYLTDGDRNGTGSNLMQYRGCHALVHSRGIRSIEYANALSADECLEGDHYDYRSTAFTGANVAWSSVPQYADDVDRGRAAVIQEVLHTFIRANQPEIEAMICDRSGYTYYDEHTLGGITADGDATPMLVFHVDEHAGCCTPRTDHDGGYTTEITSCTGDAVAYTAGDPCDSRNADAQE